MSSHAFDAIAGHQEEILRLQGMLAENRLPHAMLFHGPPGVGKAMVATALAQNIFCEQSNGCGRCPGCRKVGSGNHPDLQRVGVAADKTRISVDQIRELSHFFALTPLEGHWKVSILDDASQMNEAAANALLKTLEEPPDKSLLILITARAGSLLPTIRSRCQSLRFSPLTAALLTQIAVAKAGLDPLAAAEVVTMAEGSVSRLLQLCDGDLPALRRQFFATMAGLPTRDLAQIIAAAAEWSDKERFSTTLSLLRGWFQQEIHAKIADSGGQGPSPREILETANWANVLINQSYTFNLNKQLLLEGIFIRYCRLYQQHNPADPI